MAAKKKIFVGSIAREVVRFGFTVFGIFAFYKWGSHSAPTCDGSMLSKLGINANQLFALVIVIFLGYGIALAMKIVEAKFGKKE